MANRVTEAEVRMICEVDTAITGATFDVFISAANILVNGIVGLPAATLKEIERWLSAHFVSIRDQRVSSESAGVSQSFQVSLGLNLQVTMYGQQALMLDTTGYLLRKSLSKGARPASLKTIVHKADLEELIDNAEAGS